MGPPYGEWGGYEGDVMTLQRQMIFWTAALVILILALFRHWQKIR